MRNTDLIGWAFISELCLLDVLCRCILVCVLSWPQRCWPVVGGIRGVSEDLGGSNQLNFLKGPVEM